MRAQYQNQGNNYKNKMKYNIFMIKVDITAIYTRLCQGRKHFGVFLAWTSSGFGSLGTFSRCPSLSFGCPGGAGVQEPLSLLPLMRLHAGDTVGCYLCWLFSTVCRSTGCRYSRLSLWVQAGLLPKVLSEMEQSLVATCRQRPVVVSSPWVVCGLKNNNAPHPTNSENWALSVPPAVLH